MIYSLSKKQKGFTLVETLVAIAILMIAILGPLDIASSGLRDSMFARDQVTAYYLAQEGIEYVRFMRDYNYTQTSNNNSSSWLKGLGPCSSDLGGKGCTIDPIQFVNNSVSDPTSVISSCPSSGACPMINIDNNKNYTQSAGTSTKFTRIIKISGVTTGNTASEKREIKVQSIVSWTPSSAIPPKTITATENIFNLYDN